MGCTVQTEMLLRMKRGVAANYSGKVGLNWNCSVKSRWMAALLTAEREREIERIWWKVNWVWKWRLLEAPRDADTKLETAALEEMLIQ